MYAPICELRRNSTMLPLRSRTSWRLRALTVTCLPRDWTWAGVYHFANNRRRGHDLPEGHHGELAEQAWPRTVLRLRVLRFLSRHEAVGAHVMPLSPEACED